MRQRIYSLKVVAEGEGLVADLLRRDIKHLQMLMAHPSPRKTQSVGAAEQHLQARRFHQAVKPYFDR
jgi:hypothetical protein